MPWQPRMKRAPPDSPQGRLERDILSVLEEAPNPLGAYDILPVVARLEARRMHASQIYRALDSLIGGGLVERVESLAGYMLRREEPSLVLICTGCGAVLRTDGTALHRMLREAAERAGFAGDRTVIETLGRCPLCAAAED
jgi:Fur family zinc uptake transcriptional regulator